MAYQSAFNPDALPAHAEPEQAAQILSYNSQQRPASSPESASTNPSSSPIPKPLFHGRPQPQIPQPPPQQFQQAQQYHPPVTQQSQPLHPEHYRRTSNPALIPSHYSNGRVSPQPPYSNSGAASPYNASNGTFSPASYGNSYSSASYQQPPRSPPPPRPASAHPGGASDPILFSYFKAVDKRGTGQLTEEELRAALSDFPTFDPSTVRMMIRMFDTNRSGTIGFDEFCGLWGFLAAWRALFERFDADGSGTISFEEYSTALVTFGYHLSPAFVALLYGQYDRRGANAMGFDDFVQSCISLKRMTDVFKRYDTDRDGFVTLSFEEFLTEILFQR